MDFGDFILTLLAGAAVVAAFAIIVYLTMEEVFEWFRAQVESEDRNELAFSVLQAKAEGKVKVVQGFISTTKKSMTKYRTIEAQNVDQEVLDLHASGPVIYNR
jgi:hypothetical protein